MAAKTALNRFRFLSSPNDIPTLPHFIQPSKEIFFALMAYRRHGHGLAAFDFK